MAYDLTELRKEFEAQLDDYMAEWAASLRAAVSQPADSGDEEAGGAEEEDDIGEAASPSPGFTGTIKDTLGRQVHFVQGKRVKGTQGTGSQQRKKAARTGNPAPPAAEPSTDLAGLHGLARRYEQGQAAVKRIGQAAYAKLPQPMQAGLSRAYAVGEWLHRQSQAGMRKGRELAVEAARQRGLPDHEADRVGRLVGWADQIAAWTTNVPLMHHLAAALGGTGLAAMAVAKTGAMVPVGSIMYLTYSTARNPFATIRAARKVLASRGAAGEAAEANLPDETTTALLDGWEKARGSDWYEALLYAALDETQGDMGGAVRLADAAVKEHPTGPEGDGVHFEPGEVNNGAGDDIELMNQGEP